MNRFLSSPQLLQAVVALELNWSPLTPQSRDWFGYALYANWMGKLKTDSQLSRRIVRSFLDFLNSGTLSLSLLSPLILFTNFIIFYPSISFFFLLYFKSDFLFYCTWFFYDAKAKLARLLIDFGFWKAKLGHSCRKVGFVQSKKCKFLDEVKTCLV